MSIGTQLAEHSAKRHCLTISHRFTTEKTGGYVVGMSNKLVLLHDFMDFYPNGYRIIRIRDITKIRFCPYDEWYDHILRSEKRLGGLRRAPKIELVSIEAAVNSIAKKCGQMSLRMESGKFYIGEVISIVSVAVRFREYDALGFWSRRPGLHKLNKIHEIGFGNDYMNVFSKYTREGTPPKFPEY